MIDTELLEKTLAELYPSDLENYQEKRDIFKAGVQWGYDHPYFDKGCPNRVWHYLTEDPNDLPEPNKICLIKFSDGTGGISSIVSNSESSNIDNDGDSEINVRSIESTPRWTVRYRDDIVAWSYYVMNKINGVYI